MKVGITGHQHRAGIRWAWVAAAIRAELASLAESASALSSLAAGADQVFADVALDLRMPLIAVLPLENYERFFKGAALRDYRRLVRRAQIVELKGSGDPQHAFFEAGKYIVSASDLLIAVWDGEQAEGLGGTGDVVKYAQEQRRGIVHLNPCTEAISRL